MATGSRIHIEASQKPQYYVQGLTTESAEKTSHLLQINHEKHHTFFNRSGFHNHIAHHLCTLFALGASPAEIQKAYDGNVSYQRPSVGLKDSVIDDMRQPERFSTRLGKERYYHDFLVFFQKEIDHKGWQSVVNEYLFAGDERADDLLVRLFAGLLHPIIHLGFGIEFQQPALIAEALAQAAVHDDWMALLFLGCEEAVKTKRSGEGERKTIVQLLEQGRKDATLSQAARFEDGNKIRGGVLERAYEEMIDLATEYRIKDEDDLEEKTAEMINAAVYFTGAAQRPPRHIKFDFFYMHCVNSSIFFANFLASTNGFLTPATRRRLLEWKVWNDVTLYISRGCPELLLSEIEDYKSKQASSWDETIKRVNRLEDDGHASKLVRALAHGQEASRKFEDKDGFVIKGDMWRKLGHMAIDSVEAGEPHWVRSCGFDEAWTAVPLRDGAKL
ncbi:hypothetical protein ACN47E_001296 [Coniothyrium glycines]